MLRRGRPGPAAPQSSSALAASASPPPPSPKPSPPSPSAASMAASSPSPRPAPPWLPAPLSPLGLDRRGIRLLLAQELADLPAIDGRSIAHVVVELEIHAPGAALEALAPGDDFRHLGRAVEVPVLLRDAR